MPPKKIANQDAGKCSCQCLSKFLGAFPTILTVTIIATVGFAIKAITGMYAYDIIYNIVQKPLEGIVQGLPGILLLMFIAQVFWVIGIHGNQMVKPIREPLLLAAIAVNTEAFEAGKEVPNIITMPFWDMYMSMGGSGVTIGLLIAILIAGKREDMRQITKLSLAPGIFNINEPVIFGMPIILNPILAIPFYSDPDYYRLGGLYCYIHRFCSKSGCDGTVANAANRQCLLSYSRRHRCSGHTNHLYFIIDHYLFAIRYRNESFNERSGIKGEAYVN